MQATTTASLMKKLDDDAASMAVTTDIWTSLANYAYMSFTASYVSREWQLITPILSTMPLAERHTQTVIADQLGTIADQWKISGKISACVTTVQPA